MGQCPRKAREQQHNPHNEPIRGMAEDAQVDDFLHGDQVPGTRVCDAIGRPVIAFLISESTAAPTAAMITMVMAFGMLNVMMLSFTPVPRLLPDNRLTDSSASNHPPPSSRFFASAQSQPRRTRRSSNVFMIAAGGGHRFNRISSRPCR